MNASENCAKQYSRIHESKVFQNINKLYPFLDFVCKVKMMGDDTLQIIVTCHSRKLPIKKSLRPAQLDKTTSIQFDTILAEYISSMIAKISREILLKE